MGENPNGQKTSSHLFDNIILRHLRLQLLSDWHTLGNVCIIISSRHETLVILVTSNNVAKARMQNMIHNTVIK